MLLLQSVSPIVVLTPLSAQLMSLHNRAGPVGEKACSVIATPSLSHIDPPITGSTPLEDGNVTSTDVDTTDSPEFGYPGETATNVAMAAVYENITGNSPTVSITPLEVNNLLKHGGDVTSSDVDTSNSPEFGYCGKPTTDLAMASLSKDVTENSLAVSKTPLEDKDVPGMFCYF